MLQSFFPTSTPFPFPSLSHPPMQRNLCSLPGGSAPRSFTKLTSHLQTCMRSRAHDYKGTDSRSCMPWFESWHHSYYLVWLSGSYLLWPSFYLNKTGIIVVSTSQGCSEVLNEWKCEMLLIMLSQNKHYRSVRWVWILRLFLWHRSRLDIFLLDPISFFNKNFSFLRPELISGLGMEPA